MVRIVEIRALSLGLAGCLCATAGFGEVPAEAGSTTGTAVAPATVTRSPANSVPAATAAAVPGAPVANPIVVGPGSPKPATVPAPPAPKRRRAISPEVAAQLAAAAPKFDPNPPPQPKSIFDDEEEGVDLREIDKPRNGIIRLPKYVVREPRPPVLSERAINTEKGLSEIAMKRYGTEAFRALNPFAVPLLGSPEAVAMMMYEEDERLRNKTSLEESARMVSATDKAAGAYVRKQVDSTFLREGNFDWRPIRR